MIPVSLRLAACVSALMLSTAVQAHTVTFATPLAGTQEVPPNASPGTGFATVVFDLDLVTMHVQVNFSGLQGNTVASHIHCCTPPGANVMVATTLPTFTDFPLGVTSGSYDHTFDMSLDSSYNPAFIAAHGGTVSDAFNALFAGVSAGEAYLNVHTSVFPGGEIRGQLAQVPEPASWALMIAGFGLLGGVLRSRPRPLACA